VADHPGMFGRRAWPTLHNQGRTTDDRGPARHDSFGPASAPPLRDCRRTRSSGRGRAENFLARRSDERWLLKVFQSDYSLVRIERAADVVGFTVRQGDPAREFVTTIDGARVAVVGERVAVLVPWIDGHTPEPNTLTTPNELSHVGALCGWIHRLGAEYDAADALDFAGSTTAIAQKQDRLARVAVEAPNHEIADEVAVRLRILSRWGEALAAATRDAMGGDFPARTSCP
jgi:Ser/Thr protein kinase RdoA (MazF antagonist)